MPAPICLAKAFAPDAVELDLRFWIDDPKSGGANVKSAVLIEIRTRFAAENIIFAAPRRSIRLVEPRGPD